MRLRLALTCSACPEQYDVFDEQNNLVGYLRLRHGWFYAQYIENGKWSEYVYEAHPKGDGIFDPDERHYHLSWAVHHLIERIKNGKKPEPKLVYPDVEFTVEGNADDWGDFGSIEEDVLNATNVETDSNRTNE